MSKPTYNFPDGPPRHWLKGSLGSIDMSRIHDSVYDHRDKFGDLSYLKLPGKHVVVVNSGAVVREMFTSPDIAPFILDRPDSVFKRHILPGDLATPSYSEDWYRMRCVAHTGVVSQVHDDAMLRLFNEELGCLKTRLRDMNGEAFDPYDAILESIMNTCTLLFVGKRFDYNHELFDWFKLYRENTQKLTHPTANAILTNIPFVRFLPFWHGQTFRNVMAAAREIRKILLHDVKENPSKREIDGNLSKSEEGIGENPNQCSATDKDPNESAHQAAHDVTSKLSPDEIPTPKRGIMYDLARAQKTHSFITDSTLDSIILDINSVAAIAFNATLIAIVYQLSNRPDVQSKIYDEIINIIGKGETPHPEHATKMSYTQAVILESMRFSSIVPLGIPFSNSEDVTIRGYSLPKDTMFFSNLWRIHHDPQTWEESWTFNPLRFLDCDGMLLPEDSAPRQNLIQFGVGKRSCLGQQFAKSRVFLYVVNLCQSFEFVAEEPEVNPRSYPIRSVISPPPFTVRLRDRQIDG